MVERAGSFPSTPASTVTLSQASDECMKRDYRDLFWQHEAIQSHMRSIQEVSTGEYAALLRETENTQLAALKQPSHGVGIRRQ
jgi:hypothetical protein